MLTVLQVMPHYFQALYPFFHILNVRLSYSFRILRSVSSRGSLTCLCIHAVNLNETEGSYLSVDDLSAGVEKLNQNVNGDASLEDVKSHAIGSLLPDDEEELLAGLVDDFDLSGLPGSLEDLEDCDLFGSGGGMELEIDPQENLIMSMSKVNLSDGAIGNGLPHYALPNGVGAVAGEHPYGEHPSRTLFVRNINSNVEDSELRALFEVVQTCKEHAP